MARGPARLRPHHWLVLSVWCGLVAGPIEVGTIVVRKSLVDLNQFYWMSHHFVWLIPLTNLGIFLIVGVVLMLLALCWPRLGIGPAARLLCALALPLLSGPHFPGSMALLGSSWRLGSPLDWSPP